ncbi:YitT family protein [Macrococcus carouselicus]
MILIGSVIFSFGIINFNMAYHLTEGGFTGIALILYHLFGISPALMNLIFNIPLFIIGYRFLGRTSFYYTLIGSLSSTFFLYLFEKYPFNFSLNKEDLFLVALLGGVMIGIGLGIILRAGGTTGGVDIIARVTKKYFNWPMGRVIFMFDCLVLVITYLALGDIRITLYTFICVYVGGQIIDTVQDTGYTARGALIISEQYQSIGDAINTVLERGVTQISAHGHYSNIERPMLYCVVPKNEITRLRQLIHAIDPHAFVSMIEVHEVHGEGFTLDENKQLIEAH